MRDNSFMDKAVSGAIWTGLEKIIRQLSQFVIGIILARLLAPEEFGVIGMLAIFIAISQTFTDSGLSSALIQRKDCTDADFSTIFYFNIVVALFFYIVLFVSSPWIASFYNMPILEDVTRVVALSIIFSGLTSVQNTRLTKELKFKTQSIISIICMLVTGVTGLSLAYSGWGVWSLVFQALSGQICNSICIWVASGWMPKAVFSVTSFSKLWKFGSKLLVSSLINTIYTNLYTLVIGKAFSPAQVGHYNRANQYASLPTHTVQDMALKVNYPILAKMQDENERLLGAYKRLMSVPLYILYPILIGICVTAEPLIEVMIGEKWLPCVPMLKVLCLGYMFSPLTHLNLNLLYVKGRTDLVLKLEFIKKPIAFAILIATIPLGIIWMVAGKALYEFIAFSFNCYYTGKILGYGEIKQLKVLLPIFNNCFIMALVVYLSMQPFDTNYIKLIIGVTAGILSYLMYSILTRDSSYIEIMNIIKSKILKK